MAHLYAEHARTSTVTFSSGYVDMVHVIYDTFRWKE